MDVQLYVYDLSQVSYELFTHVVHIYTKPYERVASSTQDLGHNR